MNMIHKMDNPVTIPLILLSFKFNIVIVLTSPFGLGFMQARISFSPVIFSSRIIDALFQLSLTFKFDFFFFYDRVTHLIRR